MKIGIPKALMYYRYGVLWETFFQELGMECLVSGDTTGQMLTDGARTAVDESCLPVKLFMGHVQALVGQCDYLLVPRFERLDRNDEFCVRFWGLADGVRCGVEGANILTYDIRRGGARREQAAFQAMVRPLGVSPAEARRAYQTAADQQKRRDNSLMARQDRILEGKGPHILLAAQPYICHDPYLGGGVARLVRDQGGVPVYPDRCDRAAARSRYPELTTDLYWTMNKEILGAVQLLKGRVDGVIFLTAFPCACDSIAAELALRRVTGVPAVQILLDEQQAEAGLQTRIESFMDMIDGRRQAI